MGMASSQARLLMLTSRLHDIEYKAQNIQNAKVQLSTQEDEVYEAYQKALDATTLTMKTVNGAVQEDIPATFNSVFSVNGSRPASMAKGEGYVLLDSRGRVVVDDDVYEGYHEFITSSLNQNAYSFAMYMLYGNGEGDLEGDEWDAFLEVANDVFNEKKNTDSTLLDLYNAAIHGPDYRGNDEDTEDEYEEKDDGNGGNPVVPITPIINDVTVTQTVQVVDDRGGDRGGKGTTDKTTYTPETPNPEPSGGEFAPPPPGSTPILPPHSTPLERVIYSSHTEEASAFLNYFFSHYGELIYNNESLPDEDSYKFSYYARIYNAIQQHGGCISINDFSGPNGDAATDSAWLTAMIESGQLSIEKVAIDKNGVATFNGVGVPSDTNFNYTATSSIDKAALARAEAKYEHDLKIINRKDDKYDRELKKLETERTALTKEYDSIKKVSDDNIERTFGIFS